MKLNLTKKWFENHLPQEEGHEVGTGSPPHLESQINANVADTQAQAVLSASLPPVEKAVIHWEWKHPLPDNVNTGHGSPVARTIAVHMSAIANAEYPHITHWVVDEPSNNLKPKS